MSAPLTEEQQEELITGHHRLVYKIYRSMLANSDAVKLVDEDDAIQCGTIGLMNAARRWDPDRGTRFSSYAYLAIRNHIQEEVNKEARQAYLKTRRRDRLTGETPQGPAAPPLEKGEIGMDPNLGLIDLKDILSEALRCLQKRPRRMVVRRYGLEGNPATLREIALEEGMTKEAVRQTINRSRYTLRNRLYGIMGDDWGTLLRPLS